MEKPFGKNDVTSEELRSEVEEQKVIQHLKDKGIEEPDRMLESYLVRISEGVSLLESKGRRYPWRSTSSLYRIYITEILLQRTRGESVNKIYSDFFQTFNKPEELYRAEEREIRDEVKSLGFVNKRVKTLQSASEMLKENGFEVPEEREMLIRPWRVGPYVANATLLFGFDKSIELIDTNIAQTVEELLDYPLPRVPHKDPEFRNFMRLLTPNSPAVARPYYLAMIDFELYEEEIKEE